MKNTLLVFFLCLFIAGSFQTRVCAYEIDGIPVSEISDDGKDGFLKEYNWQILSKRDPIGVIKQFASDGAYRCAIGIGDTVFVYEKGKCVAAYLCEIEGGYRLQIRGSVLYIYSIRDSIFLEVDMKSSKVSIYASDTPLEKAYKVFEMNPGDSNAESGYYLTNFLGNRFVSFGYDRLVYVENGAKTVVYKTHIKTVSFVVLLAALLGSAIKALTVLIKRRTQRENTGDGLSENNNGKSP